jgi:hypothetical protein
VLVSVGAAAIVLFFEFVFFSIRSGIATPPEGLYKTGPLGVITQLIECRQFLRGDDVGYVFIPPLLVTVFRLTYLLLFSRSRKRVVLSGFAWTSGLSQKGYCGSRRAY